MKSTYQTVLAVSTSLALFSALAIPASADETAAMTLKQQVIGTWTLVSAENTKPDGSINQPFGAKPQGSLMMDGNGRFVGLTISGSLPRFVSNNPMTGTDNENKAIMRGSAASFGSYSVNEADKTLIQHYEGCTFTNWEGTDQTRIIKVISANEFTYTNPAQGQNGGSTTLTYRRSM
ncbi:MAG TPA: hypothetical protein HPP80_03060 [Rhodospirillaceae bacterium]|nr:hypothetical protein [Rhodospirillaceae bacterium]